MSGFMSTQSSHLNEKPRPKIILISVCYNDQTQLPRFVNALRDLRYPNFNFVLVDNGSHDESAVLVKRLYPEAVVLRPQQNLGTTGGWNLGLQHALGLGTDYVMFISLDIVLDPACLDRLVGCVESDAQIGAANPILLFSDEPHKVEMYGSSLDIRNGWMHQEHRGATDLSSLPRMRDTQSLDGGTLLVRADVIRRIGGFDEKFFMYFEDADLSLRIRKAGYRTVAVRDARAWHCHRQNRRGIAYPHEVFYLARNRFYFARKHAGLRAWIRIAVDMLWRAPLQLAYYLYHRKLNLARAYIAGIVNGVRGKMGKARRVE